ncbi:DNRLRE domain-containing protein [Streptomyces sp. 5.8]|uniref:DNRLRE domain-containing protein n=1 Tax=Streptomyces sp. 5.8 TaxID=3406571 RepID=UPI003BB4E2E2
MGGLAALLAVAIALPVAVQMPEGKKPQGQPVQEAAVAEPEARRQAAETGKEVEVTAARSANTTTWARPDGSFRKHVFSGTVRAKVDGKWKPIDTTLERSEDGFAAKAVNGRVVFSPGSKPRAAGSGERSSRGVSRVALKRDTPGEVWTELVRLNTDSHEMVVSWPGELPEPVIDGPRALYESIRPGIDLVLTAQDGGYSHVLVVKDQQAAADPLLGQLKYRLASPDLTFRLDEESGAVSARDDKDAEIAGSPTPLMWDSSGKIATTDDEPAWIPTDVAKRHPTLALSGLAGAEGARMKPANAALADNVLSLTPDRSLLDAPETVYPVFIDPSFKGHQNSWSLLYKTAPTSSFYNGQNFNSGGTNEARVGYESSSGGTSRSIFNFDFDSELHGASIISANVYALQTYSWSCTRKRMDVYATKPVYSSSTWKSTESYWGWKLSEEHAGYGYSSACPDNWVAPDVKASVAEGARAGWPGVSLGFAAPNESDSYYWKKFLANSNDSSPYIKVIYNQPPDIPVADNMKTFPGGACITSRTGPNIGMTDVTFQVKGSDRDGNLKQLLIEIWDSATGQVIFSEWGDVNGDDVVTKTVPWAKFTSGKKYFWLSRAVDTDGRISNGNGPFDSGSGAWCNFTIDHTAPPSPDISSTDFPEPGPDGAEWSVNPASTPNQVIKISGNGAKAEDIREYQWSLNRPAFDKKITPPAGSTVASVKLQVDTAGPNILYARTVETSGNISSEAQYLFYVNPRPGVDQPGDTNGDGHPDLFAIDKYGNLRSYAGDANGDTNAYLRGALKDGKPVASGYWKDADGQSALIAHSTDWFPGDGLTDVIARMPDGKLYVYPGIGTGQVDVGRRMEILLPAGAPDPATLRQIVACEDVDGDGFPDLFGLDGDGYWAFTGYTGASFSSARRLSGSWASRDLVGVRDVTGDKVPDLLYRNSTGLILRIGKAGSNGGADLDSLAAAANSEGGHDNVYAATGWTRADKPMVLGTADATGDGIPDVWAVDTIGNQWLYRGGTAAVGAASGKDEDGWTNFLTIG